MGANVNRKKEIFTTEVEMTDGLAVDTIQASVGVQCDDIALVPTSDGLTTGLIVANAGVITATSTNADHILTLPAGVAGLVGMTVDIYPVGGTNCELRTVASSNATINNVDSDGTQEALLTSGNMYRVTLVAVDTWVMAAWTNQGAALTVTPD